MRVWVPRLTGRVAVDIEGGVAVFATGERCWKWRRTADGGVECLSDVVATSLQRGQARGIAERAFQIAEERAARA